jgi:hypothetical protein
VKAIEQLQSPRTKKEINKPVHIYVGITWYAFYKLLHKADGFLWDEQAVTAFIELK